MSRARPIHPSTARPRAALNAVRPLPRRRRWVGLLVGLSLLTACQTNPEVSNTFSRVMGRLAEGDASKDPKNAYLKDVFQGLSTATKVHSAQEERTVGQAFASVLLGARPLVRNDALQSYVNQLGKWLAMGATDGIDPMRYNWRFGVLDSEAVNAYAAPGGYVLITLGLLRRLNSEAELAGVLAHEIAHVTQQHYLMEQRKAGVAQAVGGVIDAKVGGGEISKAVVSAIKEVYSRGLDKEDEFEADRLGTLYAVRAGYPPVGLARVLRMYAHDGSAQDNRFELLFATHPQPTERVSRLDQMLQSQFAGLQGPDNSERFMKVRGTLR